MLLILRLVHGKRVMVLFIILNKNIQFEANAGVGIAYEKLRNG